MNNAGSAAATLYEVAARQPFRITRWLAFTDASLRGLAVHDASHSILVSDAQGKCIWVVDGEDFTISGKVSLDGHVPGALAISPSGDVLYAVCATDRSLWAIDPATRRVLSRLGGLRAQSTDIAFSADGSTVFVSNRGAEGDVCVISTTSRHPPLEDKVAYIAPSPFGGDGLYVLDLASRAVMQVPLPRLPGESAVHNPQWSPDGRWLAFHGGKGTNVQIYVVRPDGSGLRRLTDGSGDNVTPSFSPDGSRLAFNRVYGKMYTIGVEGTGLNEIGVLATHPRWSPVENEIVYTDWNGHAPCDLFVYDLGRQTSRRITSSDGPAYNYAAWSADGRRLSVAVGRRNRGGRLCYDIYVMNPDGSGQVNVTRNLDPENERNEYYPSWTSDGRHIVFLRDATGRFDRHDIWIMRTDGSNPQNLTNTPDVSEDMPVVGWRATGEGHGPSVPASRGAPPDWARSVLSQEQIDAARKANVEPAIEVAVSGEESMKMLLIPAGQFVMGSPVGEKGRDGDERQHEVTVSKPYYLSVHEITRTQFDRFVRDTGYLTDAEKRGGCHVLRGRMYVYARGASWRMPGFSQTDDHPIVCVSWNDATAFCAWLARKTRTPVRLPTEAEWEYACRAGTTTAFQWGDDPGDGRGWCNGGDLTVKRAPGFTSASTFEWSDGHFYTSAVGSFKPNAWGLHDMHGNVLEWCSDWYAQYPGGKQKDPVGPESGAIRVLRGGCWNGEPRILRSADRYNHRVQSHADSCIGFRCARSVVGPMN